MFTNRRGEGGQNSFVQNHTELLHIIPDKTVTEKMKNNHVCKS